jgi:thiol:disulfide interchange protein DsbD
MKKLILPVIFLLMVSAGFAQSNKEVQWTYSAKKIGEKTYEVHLAATIGGDYHMYAQNGGDGPVSTTFSYTKNPLLSLEGKTKEVGKMKSKFEDAFKSTVRYYEKSVEFVQVVKLKGNGKTSLAGKVEFMVCNDRQCLPPADVNFSVNVGG